MRKKESAILNAGRFAGIIIALVGSLGLILMHIIPTPRSTVFFGLYLIAGSLIACFLTDRFSRARITLTDTGVQLNIRRTKETVTLPWTDFACLYDLPGWKMNIYLFTPAPMDKAAQLAVYKACCKNKNIPFTYEGCLILNAHVHGSIIDQYVPAHIQKMPWQHCAKI